jgi:hypothetical protein
MSNANRSERDRRYWATPKGKYQKHKVNAGRRGVPFNLTFEQWWAIWEASGKWALRGNRRGRYCMARNGDLGAYEVGNVRIEKHETNTGERNRSVVDKLHAGMGIKKTTVSKEAPF